MNFPSKEHLRVWFAGDEGNARFMMSVHNSISLTALQFVEEEVEKPNREGAVYLVYLDNADGERFSIQVHIEMRPQRWIDEPKFVGTAQWVPAKPSPPAETLEQKVARLERENAELKYAATRSSTSDNGGCDCDTCTCGDR